MVRVAVVDYGLGNLFSVCRACEHAGLVATITGAPDDLAAADAVVLPGVGAFADDGRKVPQVGWSAITPPEGVDWAGTVLEGAVGTQVYFVHSYYVRPADPSVVFSESRFGPLVFCSSVRRANVFGCQFHPERSASQGLAIYRNMARLLTDGGCW